ncbi:MAG TPA: hypothetical protein VM802_19370 [Chitinophaga sp.]|uniref:carboxymuconolactone decarboxylase family protein n=1 Tax=Chitinophaga sp. TaxID=1869181 RepID=UPI002C5CF847|nr:hypothetical protein [Chitinophaga sp.]HVI47046.1 hypothetical protein [Chitinophaga sp.]
MANINPLPEVTASPAVQAAFEKHRTQYNARITNMKATLAHSLPAFEIYMEWYRLYDSMKAILGERLAYLYAYSISKGSDCPLCTTFFRKIIIDNGERPEDIRFTPHEQLIMEFGSGLSLHHGKTDPALFKEVSRHYTIPQVVDLIAFAGQMIATNVFANATETDIDDYLQPYLSFNQNTSSHGQ